MFQFIGDRPQRFWEVLRELIDIQLKIPGTSLPDLINSIEDEKRMNEIQAAAFEKTKIPFGKYEGWEVGEIPTDYLIGLVKGEYTEKLSRYINSLRFKTRCLQE